jgi:competence protein ComEC
VIPARSLAILDVGHGNAAVLNDGRRVVVIDAGPKSGLLEYLRERRIDELDLVLVSHADGDHIAGLLAVLGAGTCRIRRVYLNSDSSKGTEIWNDLLIELEKMQAQQTVEFEVSLTVGHSGKFDSPETQIEILAPGQFLAGKGPGSLDRNGKRIATNSISAVIRIMRNQTPVALFPGDLDQVGLDDLARRRVNLSAPILIFPHHGGRAGASIDMRDFTAQICNAVSPTYVIFSISRGRGNPLPEVIDTLRRMVPNLRIACTQLSEHCAPKAPSTDPDHLMPVFARGRAGKTCCAGTLIIDLDDALGFQPDAARHQAFIQVAAAKALCR